ncbi:HTR-like protein, partial [Halorubrum sp. E3]
VIMVIALGTGLYSTLLRAGLMDMEKMGAYQDRMKDIQERRKEAEKRDDDEALDEIQEEQMEAMGDQLGMFKEQFRPMVWIMFLTIPAFLWMFWVIGYRGSDAAYPAVAAQELVVPLAGSVTWDTGIVGPIQMWILWYFLCSMAFTQLVQKSLNIEMSPSSS